MNYELELATLRKTYPGLLPEQRLKIAEQRIENPHAGANQLVTHVSAIEGLLRSIVTWRESNGKPTEDSYDRFKWKGVDDLIDIYLEQSGSARSDLVSDEIYELLMFSVKFRNLIVHECTYLGQDKYPELISACEAFRDSVVAHSGVRA